jgi:hypothetical protein
MMLLWYVSTIIPIAAAIVIQRYPGGSLKHRDSGAGAGE